MAFVEPEIGSLSVVVADILSQSLSWQACLDIRTRLTAHIRVLVRTIHLHLSIKSATMADNPGRLSIWWNIFSRSALVFVATCITICTAIAAIPVLFVMFILVAISPESFSNINFGGNTVQIRLDLNTTIGQPPAADSRPRRTTPHPTTPQVNQPSSPQSPSGRAAYTWVRQYHSNQAAPVATAFPAQQPYTWRAPSGHLPSNANILNSLPPLLPPISEPEPIPNAQLPLRYSPYTSMDTTPPTRSTPITSPPTRRRHHYRRERVGSDFSWTADDRIPPARPDDTITPSRPGASRRTTAESMPGQVPMVGDESGDEALPVYDRPPEYDDEIHSQPSPR
ncbi:hypothetical protein E4T52_04637 [Aureobasidium sp. EXF-3400]|nr:hypothetical protein E4T51_03717 [Aureobasidium sp. EXF-12344]KAI4780421.1 hypothetical protein E4T52_04637 [Aureobasidium sp. EXF-3400]